MDDEKREKEAEFLKKNGTPPDKAARKIILHLRAGKYRILVGGRMFWIDMAVKLFPGVLHKFIGRNKKRFDFI
ncbi:MAG TPA: hypothetical protein VLD19_11565 [Chitinophagaceae bacterium]|nr:hypothetical protein [Chitinophagaceae bacterium]